MSVKAVIRAARPNSCNNDDKVVFTIHASFLTAGYVLTTTDCAVGITEEVLAFARNIAMHLETWLDFPLDEEEDLGDFDMSDAQQEHATRKDGCAGSDDDGGGREPEESRGEGPTLRRLHRRDQEAFLHSKSLHKQQQKKKKNSRDTNKGKKGKRVKSLEAFSWGFQTLVSTKEQGPSSSLSSSSLSFLTALRTQRSSSFFSHSSSNYSKYLFSINFSRDILR
ncbi:hypothetical protein ACFX11_038443 [Malus domestica]